MKINNMGYNLGMHALAKHREVEEETFALSYAMGLIIVIRPIFQSHDR